MKKVFVFIVKGFYIQNNTDYAAAIDNQQIKVCSSIESAESEKEKFLKDLHWIYRNKIENEEKSGDSNSYIVKLYDGYRFVLEIIEKDLC